MRDCTKLSYAWGEYYGSEEEIHWSWLVVFLFFLSSGRATEDNYI